MGNDLCQWASPCAGYVMPSSLNFMSLCDISTESSCPEEGVEGVIQGYTKLSCGESKVIK